MQRTLKLLARYDADKNEYKVLRHNLSTRGSDAALRELTAKLFGLFVIEQHAKHTSDDPEQCELCRKDVERSSHVQPKPTFQRRNSQ
jgi:hypothetical protein